MTKRIVKLNTEKRYQRCFIGIQLPENYLEEFRGILEALTEPFLRKVDVDTGHILLEYWGEKSGAEVEQLADEKEAEIRMLFGKTITIKGLGYFDHTIKVIYLAVAGLERELHLTVARMPNTKKLTDESVKKLGSVDWSFIISEIGVFGAEERQELLINFIE